MTTKSNELDGLHCWQQHEREQQFSTFSRVVLLVQMMTFLCELRETHLPQDLLYYHLLRTCLNNCMNQEVALSAWGVPHTMDTTAFSSPSCHWELLTGHCCLVGPSLPASSCLVLSLSFSNPFLSLISIRFLLF